MNDNLELNENIQHLGKYQHPIHRVSAKLDETYIDSLNASVNAEENLIHKTILDHSIKDIINNFTNDTLELIDEIVTEITYSMNDSDDEDMLDWLVNMINILYTIGKKIIHGKHALNAGILLIIISLFIHFYNMTNFTNKSI